MNKLMLSALLALIATGSSLAAQEPRIGFALNLVVPTGSFQNLQGTARDSSGNPYSYSEGYDLGVGAQVSFSFPLDSKVALRLNIGGQSTDGSNTAPGYNKINLRHEMYSLGGDLQVFTQSAYRHRGLYFLGGIAADFERFDRSFDNLDDEWAQVNTTRKSRLGGNIGIGHTFGYNAGTRFTLEATFHKTLTGNNVNNGEPPSTDFVRVSFGWVF